jgi:hypothetical protein
VGQHIAVQPPVVVGEVAVFITDRTITGMDGMTFESASDAEARGGAPAELAARLYAVDAGLREICVAMNAIVVRRVVGWDDAHIAAVTRGIEDLFIFYSVDGPIQRT